MCFSNMFALDLRVARQCSFVTGSYGNTHGAQAAVLTTAASVAMILRSETVIDLYMPIKAS